MLAQITNYDSAGSPPVEGSNKFADIDLLARLRQDNGDDTAGLSISVTKTSDVAAEVAKILFENTVLKKAVNNLWKTVKYNNEYALFLLGQYSEEQFIDIAKKFASTPATEIDKNDVINAVNVLFSAIDSELSSHDLSTILDVDCSLIERTLSDLAECQ